MKFTKGNIPWNKGLTKKTDVRVKKYAENNSKRQKGRRNSPATEFKKGRYLGFGFQKGNKAHLGHKHSEETKGKCRKARLKQKFGNISKAELKVRKYLEDRGIAFMVQYVYPLGIADFYLPEQNLIIQCYGTYWHSLPRYIERDKKQNKWIKDNGYDLLILNSEKVIKDEMEVEKIWQSI